MELLPPRKRKTASEREAEFFVLSTIKTRQQVKIMTMAFSNSVKSYLSAKATLCGCRRLNGAGTEIRSIAPGVPASAQPFC